MQRRWIIAPIIFIGLMVSSAVLARGGARVFSPLVFNGQPTSTPTITPTPLVGAVPIFQHRAFVSEIDPQLWMVHATYSYGVGAPYLDLQVKVDWFNGGTLAHSETKSAYLITPMCLGVAFDVDSLPLEWDEYLVSIPSYTSRNEQRQGVEVIGETTSGVELGQIVTRNVRNVDSAPVYDVITYGITQDNTRHIIECAANDTPVDLAPGQSAFTVTEWFHYPNDEEPQYLRKESSGYQPQ